MAFIVGRESQLISDSSDEQITEWIGASSCGPQTKQRMIQNIRYADTRLSSAKRVFGNGISVKVIVLNFSGFHFLRLVGRVSQMGKDWHDGTVLPPGNVDPQHASPVFYGKRDWAMFGSRAGMAYVVCDADGYIKGRVALAWENPTGQSFAANQLAVAARVSKEKQFLSDALEWCEHNTGESVEGSVNMQDRRGCKKFIDVSTTQESETTCYILFAVRTDDIAVEVAGSMEI